MNIRGIKRRVDDLGRIVLPREIRQVLEIKEGQEMEIVVIDDLIIIRKVSS